MIRHLNRLYCLAYIAVIYIIYAGLHHILNVSRDNALIAGLGLVLLVVVGSHAGFHAVAFALSQSVRAIPVVKDRELPFQHLKPLETEPLTVWEWVKAVFFETKASFTITTFNQPWNRSITGIRLAGKHWRKEKPLPVLLIHGYLCNAGVWVSTRNRLDRADISSHAITLEPAIGSIRKYSSPINKAIDDLLKATGAPQVNIICHSMGGVAIRFHATEFGHDRIANVMTLGSPHFGTALSLLGIGKNVKQMAWSSFFLRTLQENPADAEFQKKFTSLWTAQDTIVSPPGSSKLEHGRNVLIRGCGHMHLLDHPATVSFQQEWLGKGACNYEAGNKPTSHPEAVSRQSEVNALQ